MRTACAVWRRQYDIHKNLQYLQNIAADPLAAPPKRFF